MSFLSRFFKFRHLACDMPHVNKCLRMLLNVSNLSKFPNVRNVKNPDVHECQTSGHYATFIDILGHF